MSSTKNLSSHIATKSATTHQTVKARNDQVLNNAGGFTFAVGKWEMLNRFLILGSEGGTYYANERNHTVQNANNVIACIKEDGFRAVKAIVDVSQAGRAPKNDPALMALALAVTHGNNDVKNYAMKCLPKVARIGTHLFHFAQFVNGLRGWGRVLREGVRDWYQDMDVLKLADQAVKYKQRDGWSHRDMLRLSHPKADSDTRNTIYKYITKGAEGFKPGELVPDVIFGAEMIKNEKDLKTALKLIQDYNLPREVIPTEHLNHPEVWELLLAKGMPMTAMLRNLAKMTAVGIFDRGSESTKKVVQALTNAEALKKARVHPLSILVAQSVYGQGKGDKGSLVWTPKKDVKDALNEAFYLAFGAIEPANQNVLFALDVSGSMHGGSICGTSLTPAQGVAAMTMVGIRTEPVWEVMGFSNQFIKLPFITPERKLDEILKFTASLPFGSTDCSMPMKWAAANKVEVDTFYIYTDNETYAGSGHPFQELRKYRQAMGRPARLVVVGMTATNFTIADPNDAGMMDVVGFDTSAPNIMSAFARGEL
jgi:60 kDa SS-A/Ro ribonucleoprotein